MDNNVLSPKVRNPIILVADDSELVRSLIEKAFDSRYRILMASNGFDTIDIIEANVNNDIAWVLLDLNMPEMGGFKVLDYFKENNLFKKIPVTVISGDDSEETSKKVKAYDIVEMLVKPFTIKAVQEGIDKALNSISNSK